MKCSRHTDNEGVAQCAECGAYVCESCAEKTRFLKDDCGTLCIDCCSNKLSEAAEIFRKDSKKRRTRAIVSSVLYVFGIILLIAAFTTEGQPLMMIVLAVIMCGIYTGLTWRKAAKESHEDYERKHGVTYNITENGVEREDGFWMKLVFFIIGTVFGIIVTPIRLITDIAGIARNKKSINDLNECISALNQI